jgi:Kef-type K+ transport system membrane component KefB
MNKKKRQTRFFTIMIAMAAALVATPNVLASTGSETGGDGHGIATIFLWVAILLVLAKLVSLIERFGQPAVLGELVLGVVLGNLTLIGVYWFAPMAENEIIKFMAEMGVVILLFQVGLETRVIEMRQVGMRAALVAIVGVVLPFVLGTYVIGPLLLPNLSTNTYLFLGAALTATSVGITARVFQDLGTLRSSEAKIVLGAAVIDDVLGLIVLAVVSAIVTFGVVSVGQVAWIIAKAVLFLGGAIILGQLIAPYISRLFSKINAGIGMKFVLAFGSALVFANLAEAIGLAPIVGAFTAGLILEPVHFRDFKDPDVVDHLRETLKEADPQIKQSVGRVLEAHSQRHVEELLEPIGFLFVPIFFVLTGMAVKLDTLFNPSILLVALGITVVAILGKLVAGWVAGSGIKKSVVGWGMVPRGEVGLIFATIGRSLGVVSDEVFSVIIIMVILTTLMTPPVLSFLLKRQASSTEQLSSTTSSSPNPASV